MKLAILAPLLLTGCAIFTPAPYIWYDTGKPKLERVEWEKHPISHVQHACDFGYLPANTIHAGCVFRLVNSGQPYCLVISTASADEAKRIIDPIDGKTVYEHEAGEHCNKALNHWRKV